MKKNVMMRIASLLLVCVLATTCGISGTFAKYVTEASGSDSARVAKFGVQLYVGGGSFAEEYAADENGIDFSVNSANSDDVVAPGTKDANGVHFSIAGTPEVAVKVDVIMDEIQDVYLKAGTYIDYTKVLGYTADNQPVYGTFKLTEDYYPIVYTLKQVGVEDPIETGNLATIKAALDAYTASAAYAPNTELDSEFVLTWEWVFEHGESEAEIAMYAAADTWLGNAAAGIIWDANAEYSINIAYDLTVVVTQIN